MEQAKVYFTDFRCHPGLNQQQKLEKLLTTAGMGNIDFEGKIVAISCTSVSLETLRICARITRRPWRTLSRPEADGRF